MNCPQCGYVMDPFQAQCPRCNPGQTAARRRPDGQPVVQPAPPPQAALPTLPPLPPAGGQPALPPLPPPAAPQISYPQQPAPVYPPATPQITFPQEAAMTPELPPPFPQTPALPPAFPKKTAAVVPTIQAVDGLGTGLLVLLWFGIAVSMMSGCVYLTRMLTQYSPDGTRIPGVVMCLAPLACVTGAMALLALRRWGALLLIVAAGAQLLLGILLGTFTPTGILFNMLPAVLCGVAAIVALRQSYMLE